MMGMMGSFSWAGWCHSDEGCGSWGGRGWWAGDVGLANTEAGGTGDGTNRGLATCFDIGGRRGRVS